MNKIYAVANPMWYADTFIFSYMEDFGCYVYVKVNIDNKIEEIGINLEKRMHNTKFEDMDKNEASRLQKSIFNRIGMEYWWGIYNQYQRIVMETKFDFKSQICTDKNQSERLLALGLKPDTADMVHCIKTRNHLGDEIERHSYYSFGTEVDERPLGYAKYEHFPAWSLHRLIEMMPEEMYGGLLCIFKDSIRYEEVIMDRLEAHFEVIGENMYENAISCIEWLIKEGYFPKEYLVLV